MIEAIFGLGSLVYVAIALALIASTISIPIPEDIVLLLAGYFAATGTLNIWILLPVAISGVMIGDNIGFWIGRHGGNWLKKIMHEKVLSRVNAYYQKHGQKTVFFSRFFTGIRNIFHMSAGASGMPWKRFVLFDTLGAITAVPLVIGIGYFFGTHITAILRAIRTVDSLLALVAVILFVLAAALVCFFRNKVKKSIINTWVTRHIREQLVVKWYVRQKITETNEKE